MRDAPELDGLVEDDLPDSAPEVGTAAMKSSAAGKSPVAFRKLTISSCDSGSPRLKKRSRSISGRGVGSGTASKPPESRSVTTEVREGPSSHGELEGLPTAGVSTVRVLGRL